MSSIGRFFRRNRENAIDILLLFLLVQVVAIAASLLYPESFRYLSTANISVMLKAVPVLGVIALGVGILMIAGEFDLSVGAVYTFTAIVMATFAAAGMSPFIAAPLALLLGIGIGLLNGFITITFGIPSFITTLGTMLFWSGMTLFIHGATAIRFHPGELFSTLLAGNLGVIQASFLWFMALALLAWAVLHHHKLGNHFFAVGGNKQAATAIGINPNRVKLIAFGITGFCAAMSGVVAASRVGSIQPGQGAGLELQAIAACVIGGVALSGGRGSILGIILGAALIYTIQDILLLMRAPGFYLEIFVGILIVGAAIFNAMVRRRSSD
jgi:ribose/xylose/arabinose/galactoside ABC-type transport system permease subunit